MKMKKILAAVLAGTMVFAMTVPVFAENRVTKRMQSNVAWECWWNGADDAGNPLIDTDGDGNGDYKLTDEEYENKFFYFDDLEEDGEWSIPMQCVLTENGDDEMYTVTGDIYDDNDAWISYGTHGDCWGNGVGKATGQNTSVDPQLKAGDIVTFTLIREGSEFTIKIAKNGTDFLRFKCTDATLDGDKLHTRVGVQFGVWDIYPVIEGDAKAAIDTVDAGASEAATKTGTTGDATTGDATTGDATTGTSGATAGDSGSSSSSSSSSTTATTPKTGDSTPIVAILVAIAGCGAVAFASKKRFAK